MGGCHEREVQVKIENAGQHQGASRVEHALASRLEAGTDFRDPPGAAADIGLARPGGGHQRAAPHQQATGFGVTHRPSLAAPPARYAVRVRTPR